MRDDFVVFIITHKRPDNQITYKTLKRGSVAYGKTGFIKRVRWNNLLPQIINEKWRKGYEK